MHDRFFSVIYPGRQMISRFFYNLSLRCLSSLYELASVMNAKAKKWVDGRKITDRVLEEIMVFRSLEPEVEFVWFHCASLGEFEQGRTVIEAFRKSYPRFRIVLTFFSPSGYEVRKNYDQADHILYLPVDTPENARRFVDVVHPKVAFFVKYEFWANFLEELQHRESIIIGVSVILRPGQVFFKAYGSFFRAILHRFNHIFAQNQLSADLLRSINYNTVTIAGDTRFDRVSQIAGAIRNIDIAADFKGERHVMVVGSAWQEDMAVLIPFMNAHPEMAFIVAPHEIHDQEIATWQQQITGKTVRYSEASGYNSDARVLFIDNVGMLSSLYQYGEYAYIGGSFGKGLHNILEAAVFGVPLFFGNKRYEKFKEAQDLIALGAAFPVSDVNHLEAVFGQMSSGSEKYEMACRSSSAYVIENTGATNLIMDYLAKVL